MNFFVSATDTDVGKSYICARLAREFAKLGLKTGYFKPFQSGLEKGVLPDAKQILEIAPSAEIKNSYITKTPCTPLISAKIDGVEIVLEKVKKDYLEISSKNEVTIVEGSGGFYVPVAKNALMSDVVRLLDLPMLIVARPNLGTINHTLMTIKCAQAEGIEVLGVVISNYPNKTDDPVIIHAKEMIENYCDTRVLDMIKNGQEDLSQLAKKILLHAG